MTCLNQTELFSSVLILESATIQNTINTKAILNYLDQVLKFLESFQSWKELPISEIIQTDFDAVLSFLFHLDFQNLTIVLNEYLVAIFGFFGFYPNCFYSRLSLFGVLDFMVSQFGFKGQNQSNSNKKILNFTSNLIIDSSEIIHLLNKKKFFEKVSQELNETVSNHSTKLELVLLFNNLSNLRILITDSDQRFSG